MWEWNLVSGWNTQNNPNKSKISKNQSLSDTAIETYLCYREALCMLMQMLIKTILVALKSINRLTSAQNKFLEHNTGKSDSRYLVSFKAEVDLHR